MIRFFLAVVVVAAALLLPNHQGAAQGRAPGAQPGREEMVPRIRARFQARLAEELELDREERESLGNVLTEFGEARKELPPRRRALGAEIREFMLGDQPEDRAMELIEELRALRQQEADLLIEEENRLLEELGPSRVLRLQSLRGQFRNQVQRLGPPGRRDGPGRRGGRAFPPAR